MLRSQVDFGILRNVEMVVIDCSRPTVKRWTRAFYECDVREKHATGDRAEHAWAVPRTAGILRPRENTQRVLTRLRVRSSKLQLNLTESTTIIEDFI